MALDRAMAMNIQNAGSTEEKVRLARAAGVPEEQIQMATRGAAGPSGDTESVSERVTFELPGVGEFSTTLREGESQRDAVNRFAQSYTENQKGIAGPTEGIGKGQLFLEGIGSGAVDVGRQAASLLPDRLEPEWASKEARDKQAEMDAPLMDTGAGLAGNIVGGALATAPVGGLAGGAARGLGAAAKGAGGLSKAAKLLGSKPAVAGVQGATEGALLGGEDAWGSGTALGGGIGLGMGGLGRAARGLKNQAKKLAPTMSKEAKYLEAALPETQIPLPGGGEGGIGTTVYESIVANLPGPSKMLRNQRDKAFKEFETSILQKAMPENVPEGLLKPGQSVDEIVEGMETAWKGAFDDIAALPVFVDPKRMKLPPKVLDQLGKHYKSQGGRMPQLIPGQRTTGAELLGLKQAAQEMRGEFTGQAGKNMRGQIDKFRAGIDDMMGNQMDPTGKGRGAQAEIFREFKRNQQGYKKWNTVKNTLKKDAELKPSRLTKSAPRGTKTRELGKAADKTLKDFANEGNIYQALAAGSIGVLPFAGLGAMASDDSAVGAGLGGAGAYGMYALMATPKGQRIARQLAKVKDPSKKARMLRDFIGRSGRDLTVSAADEELK